ncbi:type II toxin-antitoxin system PemK/MazF family toxin [Ferroplasma sp.]|uniref:type II toxin-antitoxin system PemK/MazF family toxin n=1 Tax=Ferroplasma sp. TaxID=2591003 RepID=UPI00262BE5CF|nr:type II toxin-antitoxin system PemK/MazF family toxin [Ferroplasma sp.]
MINIGNIIPGYIYYVSLNDATGHEQFEDRPALVISVHKDTKLAVVIPFTTSMDAKRFSYTVEIKKTSFNNLKYDSIAMIFQIRAISNQRFKSSSGVLEDNYMKLIKTNISLFLKIP